MLPPSNAARQDPTAPVPPDSLHRAAFDGDVYTLTSLIKRGANINETHLQTRMTPLQIAVGMNHIEVVRALVANNALFTPDPEGRMPSLIAIECCASDDLRDFIVEAELAAG